MCLKIRFWSRWFDVDLLKVKWLYNQVRYWCFGLESRIESTKSEGCGFILRFEGIVSALLSMPKHGWLTKVVVR